MELKGAVVHRGSGGGQRGSGGGPQQGSGGGPQRGSGDRPHLGSGGGTHLAEGRLLVLEKPISFWGGVDPLTGRIGDPRHPRHGTPLQGRVLVMERTIGSSSSSAVMLELLRNRVAPAAIIVGRPDAILVLGLLVAEELGYDTIPMLRVGRADIARLAGADGVRATVREGILRVEEDLGRGDRQEDRGRGAGR